MVVSVEIGGKQIPKTLEAELVNIRDRVAQLTKQYKTLSAWGRPYLFSIDEVATIYYVNNVLGVSLDRLSNFLGVDKTSLYKIIRKIDGEHRVSYYDVKEAKVITTNITPEELITKIEEKLNISTKSKISDPLASSIIRKFMTEDIEKRAKVVGHNPTLNEKQKKEVLKIVKDLMNYFNDVGKVSNPDMWEEREIEKALWEVYKEYPKVSRAMIILRRVPEWKNWFEGKIGAVTKRVNPKMSVIYYSDYVKIKDKYLRGLLNEDEFLIIWLHLTTGAREGYTLYSKDMDLDNESVKSSLVGLKWENLSKVGNTYILKVWESKTSKWWSTDLSWLDEEIIPILLKYSREKGSIVKSITGLKTVGEFVDYYRDVLQKISKMLELPFILKPHDIRRSHISILAELGVPLELAVSGHMDFGVGWEDLKTAVVFYLRFSKYVKQQIMKNIQLRKEELKMST